MKILYIHQHFALPSEGNGGRPYQFAKRLAANGHEVIMLCAGARPLDMEIDGFRVKRLQVSYENEMSIPRRIWAFADFMIRASYFSARLKADLVFASSTPLTVGIPGMIAKAFQRVPLVFEVRDLWPKIPIEMGFLTNPLLKRLALGLEKLIYQSADHVIALSPGMADGVTKVSPNSKVTVIPNASDLEIFNKTPAERRQFRDEQGWNDDEVVAVYAGGFGKVYSLDWVVGLAAKTQSERIRFVLIGQGSESENLAELANSLGLDPEELFLGKKPREEVASFVAAADLVISSSRLDPCLEPASLNKVFDGFAAGRPIILNHWGWLTDLVEERSAGWKLDRALDSATEQIQEIINMDKERERFGRNSLELAREEFDRDKLFEKFHSVIMRTHEESSNK